MTEVYWNLHRDVFSIRENGRVVQHAEWVELRDVTFVVQPAGHAEVLRTGTKNVHAWVKGDLHLRGLSTKGWTRIRYCPFDGAYFQRARDGKAVAGADWVTCRVEEGRPVVLAKGIRWVTDR